MDELAKTEARNYLAAAGFFLIAANFIVLLFSCFGTTADFASLESIQLALGIGLLIVATLLIVLHKRDMVAILFFMMGFFQLYLAFTPPGIWSTILVGFVLLVVLVTLAGQDKKKWMLFIVPLIWFISALIRLLMGFNLYVAITFYIILAVLCLYYAFCCACERCSLPGSKLLTADEQTDFKASGSVLGYMLFALVAGGYALHYLVGDQVLSMASLWTIECLTASLLIYVAILLLVVGRMRFTPVMFLMMGLTSLLSLYCSGGMFVGIMILYVVIGLFAMLRKESRILPGIMLIVYGLVFLFTDSAGASAITSPVVSFILNAIPCLIAIYLAFVVYSQRKLPKF